MNKTARIIRGAANVCALIGGLIEIFIFTKDYIVPAIRKRKNRPDPAAEEATEGQSSQD